MIYSNLRSSGDYLGEKLRAIAKELIRSADLLQGLQDDTILMFDEQVNQISTDISKTADIEVIRNYLQSLERKMSKAMI